MGTAAVVLGSLVAAVLAYAFQVFGGRLLGAEAFAPITVLWTVQFLAMQVLYQPLEHYVNRETGLGRTPHVSRIVVFGAGFGLVSAFSMAAMGNAFGLSWQYAVLGGVMVAAYAVFGYVRGVEAGTERFHTFGIVTSVEAAFRMVVALGLGFALGAYGFAWAMTLAPFVAFIWLKRRKEQGAPERMTASLTSLVAASAFSQALLGLPPLVAGALGAGAAVVSVVFMTFAMYRGPLWVLQGIMARLLPVFVDHAAAGAHRALRSWLLALTATAAALGTAAFAFGAHVAPPLFELLLGAEFRPDPELSALVSVGVIVAACAYLLNQLLLALDALRLIVGAWSAGFAIAAAFVALHSGSPTAAVGQAFLTGELVAFAALVVATSSVLMSRKVTTSSRQVTGAISVGALETMETQR